MRTNLKMSSLAVVAVLAVACGSSSTPAADKTSGSGAGELTEVTVNIVPFTPNAVMFLAMENGTFKKHGLKVTIARAASPVPVVASLVSGKSNFGFVTTPVLINANRQGTAIKCVAPIDGQVSPERDASALVASKASGITSLKDLAGKKVAVVQLASINLIGAKKLIEDAGAKGTQYVALPFPQMPQALAAGQVDAAVITSPYVETALKAGAVELAAPSSDLFPTGTIYCYAATAKYLDEKPALAKAFQDAMVESITYAGTHEDEAKATLVKYLELTPEQATAQVIPSNYVPKINLDSIGKIQDLMKAQGMITNTVSPADLVWVSKG